MFGKGCFLTSPSFKKSSVLPHVEVGQLFYSSFDQHLLNTFIFLLLLKSWFQLSRFFFYLKRFLFMVVTQCHIVTSASFTDPSVFPCVQVFDDDAQGVVWSVVHDQRNITLSLPSSAMSVGNGGGNGGGVSLLPLFVLKDWDTFTLRLDPGGLKVSEGGITKIH